MVIMDSWDYGKHAVFTDMMVPLGYTMVSPQLLFDPISKCDTTSFLNYTSFRTTDRSSSKMN
jgi:hypothetical protein